MRPPLSLLPIRHPLIRLLHHLHLPNHLQPLPNPRITIQLQLRIRIEMNPRIEMRIHSAQPTARQHTLPTTLPQLPLQHVKRPVRLRFVPRRRILVLRSVVVPVPQQLPHHGPERAREEELPLVEIDVVLFRRFAAASAGACTCASWAQLVGLVVHAQQVVDDGAAFPG